MAGRFSPITVGGAGLWESKAVARYVLGLDSETNKPIPLTDQTFFYKGRFRADLCLGGDRENRNENIDENIQLNVHNHKNGSFMCSY
jgi:hypothetical protein